LGAVGSRSAVSPLLWRVVDGPAGDEHVFLAVVGDRFVGEAAVQVLQFEAGDVDEPEPLVLGCPPQAAGRAAVEDDVDTVVADRLPDRVRDGILLMLAV